MVRLLNILWLLVLTNLVQGQSIFFIEHIIVNNVIPRNSDSYKTILTLIDNKDTFRLENPKIGVHWIPINKNEVLGSGDLNTIQKIDLLNNKYELLFKSNDYIVCLTASSNYCYFVLTDNESNRFLHSTLYRMNLKDYKIEQIAIPKSINFSHFNVSPNDKWLSFVSHDLIDHYLLLNLVDNKIIEIDKAKYANKEYFRAVDDGLLSYWIDDDNLFYFKKDSSSNNGYIYKYKVSDNIRYKYLAVPEERIGCFTYYNGNFFFIEHGDKIYKYNSDGTKDYIYKCKKQFEFIEDGIFLK